VFRLLKLSPPHGWRAVWWELGIVSLGVLVALGAQQVVDTAQWRGKVARAKTSIHFEINDQLDYAEEVLSFAPCVGPYIDALEQAILRGDRAAIAKLHDTRPPFEGHPWRSTAWESAMSTQIADHLPQEELDQYAVIFTSFNDIAEHQDAMMSAFAEATAGRVGGPTDPMSTQLQLMAAERLRMQLAQINIIAAAVTNEIAAGKSMAGWKPIERRRWQRLKNETGSQRELCLATVRSVAAPLTKAGGG
jgi:hypothetical protein